MYYTIVTVFSGNIVVSVESLTKPLTKICSPRSYKVPSTAVLIT